MEREKRGRGEGGEREKRGESAVLSRSRAPGRAAAAFFVPSDFSFFPLHSLRFSFVFALYPQPACLLRPFFSVPSVCGTGEKGLQNPPCSFMFLRERPLCWRPLAFVRRRRRRKVKSEKKKDQFLRSFSVFFISSLSLSFPRIYSRRPPPPGPAARSCLNLETRFFGAASAGGAAVWAAAAAAAAAAPAAEESLLRSLTLPEKAPVATGLGGRG